MSQETTFKQKVFCTSSFSAPGALGPPWRLGLPRCGSDVITVKVSAWIAT